MSRPGREKKREQQYRTAGAVIDVHVPGAGQGTGGTGSASIGGVPVVPAPGEELQRTVLNHLHRIALATGRPVLATVHDERIGYVVPLRVHPDGSSCFAAEPVRTSAAQEAVPAPPRPLQEPAPAPPRPPQEPGRPAQATRQDNATQLLRTPPTSAATATPTFRLRAVQEPQPLGEFGPPPVMDARPHPEPLATPEPNPEPQPDMGPGPQPDLGPEPDLGPGPELDPDPDPKPTPPRGFDAVAEAILVEPADLPSPTSTLLAEPTARIGEAVKAGQIDTAAALAEQAVAEASAALAPDHPELLRLLELTAYIAYLAADPVRAFSLSLDVARIHRRRHDAEGAYGNVQSAATAWRAVRDPALGLDLGRELIGLWVELATEGGPAADDVEELESARARMGRLAARAGGASGA
ncbi:tetratricopeptide repeat protein [Streptomyces sp. TRM72054]|uniref:tetratricopeptide repeat protein n=1 Tax=Streptomyces sp. TRM72054 TaxID=2870562 RepID=UPI001C8B41FF|nr:tetratricopeptide repeat protein [Streptomyces sp. TRM72054]MBX9396224.1 tetratricopeptide repeat protein [Streptomyces sp. TRM72054]